MSLSELEKLRNNVGGLIAMNSFVSTSRFEDIALVYIEGAVVESDIALVLFVVFIQLNKSYSIHRIYGA